MNESKACKALHDAGVILRRHAAQVWLDCGTLLGAVRNGSLIQWDDDIDLSLWEEEWDRLEKGGLWSDLHAGGFDVYRLPDKIVVERDGIPINISRFHSDENVARKHPYPLHTNSLNKAVRVVWWALRARRKSSSVRRRPALAPSTFAKRALVSVAEFLPERSRQRAGDRLERICLAAGCRLIRWAIPRPFFEALDEIVLYGDPWLAPRDLHGYLAFRYGDDWRTPRENFSTVDEDGAIVRPGSPS